MSAYDPFPVTGPGSQPSEPDGVEFDYMEMPDDMVTYAMPMMPEPEEVNGVETALDLLAEVQKTLSAFEVSQAGRVFDLTALDGANKAFINQVLGEGEVSAVAGAKVQVQESVLAGVWRLYETDSQGKLRRDLIEIAAFPGTVLDLAQRTGRERSPANAETWPDGVANAPALLTELADATDNFDAAALADEAKMPHVINLSLLPLTEEDMVYLDQKIGRGQVSILSRGYGNCRITNSHTRHVWWVQYFNSREALILNTIEVSVIPDVACAAQEDIDDSAERLAEILGVYR